MNLTFTLIILQFVLLSHCWIVPRDLEDGVYHITLPHHDNNTTEPLVVKRSSIPMHPHAEADVLAPSINNPDEDKDVETFRRLPLHEKPGDHGKEGRIPFKFYDCIFNEPPMLEDEYHQARANLFAYCHRWRLPPKTAHIAVAKKGDVVVYACSWSKKTSVCSKREFAWVENRFMNPNCGTLTPAWSSSRSWKKSYGRGWIGSQICKADIYDRLNPNVRKNIWVGLPPDMDDKEQIPGRHSEGVEYEY